MSLKVFVPLFMFMVGLVAQSSASPIKIKEEDQPIPGFTYENTKYASFVKLSLNVKGGFFALWWNSSGNKTAWSLIPGNGSNTIVQQIQIPFLYGVYNHNASATVGDVSANGSVAASFYDTEHKVLLTASGEAEQCRLESQISVTKKVIGLGFYYLDEVKDSFAAPKVSKEVKLAVWDSLVDLLPVYLTDAFKKKLQKEVNTAELCQELLVAKPTTFPQPDLWK